MTRMQVFTTRCLVEVIEKFSHVKFALNLKDQQHTKKSQNPVWLNVLFLCTNVIGFFQSTD